MSVKTLLESSLVEEATNEPDAAPENKEAVEATVCYHLVGFLRGEGSTTTTTSTVVRAANMSTTTMMMATISSVATMPERKV
jgi:hypothetical protein